MDLPPAWTGSLAVAALFAVVYLADFCLGHASGWRTLAERFRADGATLGDEWYSNSIHLNGVRYNGTSVLCSAAGLYLSVFPLFTRRTPPLLIPWEALEPIREETVFWVTRYDIPIRVGEETVTLSVSGDVMATIREYLPAMDRTR